MTGSQSASSLQPLSSSSPIPRAPEAPFEPVTDPIKPVVPGLSTAPTGSSNGQQVVKTVIEENSGSDSGQDVRSPGSANQSDQTVNSSSPTSHQSNTSSGFGDTSQHQPFLSYSTQPFYQPQYGYVPLDMSQYPQYQNVYSNQA